MAVSAAGLNALVEEAIELIAASSWRAAKAKLIAASAMLMALPDRRHGDAELKYDRGAISDLLKQVEAEARRVSGGGGLQSVGMEFRGDRD